MSLKLIDLINICYNVIINDKSYSEIYLKNDLGHHFNFDNYDNCNTFIIFSTRVFNLISQNKNINWVKKTVVRCQIFALNGQLTKLVTMKIRRS